MILKYRRTFLDDIWTIIKIPDGYCVSYRVYVVQKGSYIYDDISINIQTIEKPIWDPEFKEYVPKIMVHDHDIDEAYLLDDKGKTIEKVVTKVY